MSFDISIITVSHRGDYGFQNVVRNVEKQVFTGRIQLIYISDNNSPGTLCKYLPPDNLQIEHYSVHTDEALRSAPAVFRVSRLRNFGLSLVQGTAFCFLDDDNQWDKFHLSSLINTLEANAELEAAYCWRRLYLADGTEWNGDDFPWGFDEERKLTLYEALLRAGIVEPGSNLFRDVLFIEVEKEIIPLIDMGSWIFSRDMLKQLRFDIEYSDADILNSITEDDKLIQLLIKQQPRIASTRLATLNYYLGGYSNG